MDRVLRGERVALVVDDDIFVRSALAELLSEDGYDVHTTSNGFSALRMAVQYRPSVILLDLALPERGGTEVLADLRADPTTRDVAIIVVTGNPHLLTDAQMADTDGFITKPFDVAELMSAVQRAVSRATARQTAEVTPVAAAASHAAPPVRPRRGSGVHHGRGHR